MSDESKFTGFFKNIRKGRSSDDEKPVEKSPVESDEDGESSEPEIPEETVTEIRQNFHVEVEKCLNKQINLELRAGYTYRAMGIYFNRHDVALTGFSRFFIDGAEEEKEHATEMMRYMNKRGGKVVLDPITKPPTDDWGTGLEAMQKALEMEKKLNEALLKLHKLTVKYLDPHADKFVKKYIDEQVEVIKKLGDYVTNLTRVGPGLGEYMFDQKTLNGEKDSDSSDSSDSSSSSSSDSSDSDSDD